MVAINQRIPNFLGGVSQQPDTIKFPGQLRVCDNAVPDVTFGLMKRPPGEFVKKLTNANADGYWYEILRDGDEKFLVQITPANTGANPIRVWTLTDITVNTATDFYDTVTDYTTNGAVIPAGTELTVNAAAGLYAYLAQSEATSPYSLQSIQDYTLITNPQKPVGTTGFTEVPLDNGDYAFARLDTIAYNTEYVLYETNTHSTGPDPKTYRRATALKVEWRGPETAPNAWAVNTFYNKGDFVTSNGETYQCMREGTSIGAPWKAGVSYSVNDKVSNDDGKVYKCTVAGTSATTSGTVDEDSNGPTGTATSGIEDGGTLEWGYEAQNHPDENYLPTDDAAWELQEIPGGNTWDSADVKGSFTGLNQFSFEDIAGCENLEGHVTVNASTYVHTNDPQYQASSGTNPPIKSTGNSGGFIGYSQNYRVRYTAQVTLKDGGIIKVSDDSTAKDKYKDIIIEGQKYRVQVTGVENVETYEGVEDIGFYKTPRNPDEGSLNMLKILKGLKDSIGENSNNLASSGLNNVTAEIIGNGLYLTGSNAPKVNFLGGAVNEHMNVIGNTAQDIGRLPSQCKHGYIAQIANDSDVETDNYYVKFIADNGTGGSGKWEECVRPNNFTNPTVSDLSYVINNKVISIAQGNHPHTVGDKLYVTFTHANGPDDGFYTVESINDTVTNLSNPSTVNNFTLKEETESTISSHTNNTETATVSPDYMLKGLDPSTMPHALVNNRDGTFTFKKLDVNSSGTTDNYWKDRDVGDDVTNPFPSFNGKNIQKIFFHRNRLGMIANEQIVMSRPGDYFNFSIVSAITTSDDNPVDITVSDIKPAFINHTLPIQKGLMLFSDNGQFLLFTESDIFSPKTARLKKVTSYECSDSLQPRDMGTSVMFTSSVSAYTRAYEATILDDDVPPQVIEQTRVVPEYIPKDVTMTANSTSLGIVTFGKKNSSQLYHYKYFDSGQQRDQSAWYSWTLTGTLQHMVYTAGSFYVVTKQGDDYMLCRHEYVTDGSVTRAYTVGGIETNVGSPLHTSRWFEACLDNMVIPTTKEYTGQTTTDPAKTVLTFTADAANGYDPTSAANFYAIGLDGDYAGVVVKADSVGTNNATFNNIDMSSWQVAVGYKYTSTIELPDYHLSLEANKFDTNGSLKISALNFDLGVSGPMEFHLTAKNSYTDDAGVVTKEFDDYIQYESGMIAGLSEIGKPPAELNKSVRVPIQKKNTKYNLQIKIPDPFSTALISASWDGIYNQRRHVRR